MFEYSKIRTWVVLLLIVTLAQSRRLVQVHEIFRHGARYPLRS